MTITRKQTAAALFVGDASQNNRVRLSDDVVCETAAFSVAGANLQITGTTISANGTTGLDVECGISATNVAVANKSGRGVHIDLANPGDAPKNLTIAGNGGAGGEGSLVGAPPRPRPTPQRL